MLTRTTLAAAATAALLLGPAPRADEPTPYDRESRSPSLAMIDDAVEITKHDPAAVAFIIALPEDTTLASRAIDVWSRAATEIPRDTPVFFVTGSDRDEVLEKSSITQTPAFIAYRNGLPLHARTSCADPSSLSVFISIALDETAPPTYSPDQTRVLYDDMVNGFDNGLDRTAAEHGCMLLMTIHALTEGPYGDSFASCETAQMYAMYNTSMMRVASAASESPTVAALLAETARTAMRTFDRARYNDLGIALFMDIAPSAGMTDELVAWVDTHTINQRVAKALADHGQRIAPLLIDTQRWGALAQTYTSKDQIIETLAAADAFARVAVEDGIAPRSFLRSHKQDMTRVLALTHAALLTQGREQDAWDVASALTNHAGEQPAAVAILESAIELNVTTQEHSALASIIDQGRYADLINAFEGTAISVETGLTED